MAGSALIPAVAHAARHGQGGADPVQLSAAQILDFQAAAAAAAASVVAPLAAQLATAQARITALENATVTTTGSTPDGTPTTGTGTVTPQPVAGAITRSGTALQVNGSTRRFGGANCYWFGLDDNNGGVTFPSHTQINAAVTGLKEMGVNLVRSHSIGISTGTSKSYETAAGVYNDANLEAADWAVYQCGLAGIKLMVPMTDNWNYYQGGKWNFVHWAYQQNPSGINDTPGTIKDDVNERVFFADSTAGRRVRALFKDYISHWLNHLNPYTGLKYKDDPTIAIVETGNELYYAAQLGTDEWTQDICSYIKSIAPNKLCADGSAASGVVVSTMPGLTAGACDIVGSHYYPQATSTYASVSFGTVTNNFGGGTARSAIQQLAVDTAAASSAGKAFIVGEFPWTRSDAATWYTTLEGNTAIASDMFWAYIANTDSGSPEVHGGAFGSDDYPVHRPYSGSNEQTYAPALSRHIGKFSGLTPTNSAGTDPGGGGGGGSANLLSSVLVRRASSAAPFTGGSCTVTVDSTVSQEGGTSIKCTPSGAGVYPYVYPKNFTTDCAAVTPGQQYTGVASLRPATSQSGGAAWHFALKVAFFKADGSYIATTTVGADTVCPSGTWTQLTCTVAAADVPALAAYANIQPQSNLAMGTADVFNVDEFGFFTGTNTTWSA